MKTKTIMTKTKFINQSITWLLIFGFLLLILKHNNII